MVEAGQDPAALERKAETQARSQTIRTYEDLVEAYFAACEAGAYQPKGHPKKPATIEAERSLYRRHLKKELARQSIGEISRAEIKAATGVMRAKGITTQSNHAHALIRQTFSYAVDRELVSVNPAMGLRAPAPKRARERTLDDTELKALWAALKDRSGLKDAAGQAVSVGDAVAIALRLVGLLLQRRAEVATMRIEDLDLEHGIWIIPSGRAKNGRAHSVPLPPASVALIKAALALKNRRESTFVFPSPRDAKASVHPDALTRAMGKLMKALGLKLAGPHDLRRTGSSVLASERGGVQPFVISQLLNHTADGGGGSATTRRHYNLHLYASEKRQALEAWGVLLGQITEGAQAT